MSRASRSRMSSGLRALSWRRRSAAAAPGAARPRRRGSTKAAAKSRPPGVRHSFLSSGSTSSSQLVTERQHSGTVDVADALRRQQAVTAQDHQASNRNQHEHVEPIQVAIPTTVPRLQPKRSQPRRRVGSIDLRSACYRPIFLKVAVVAAWGSSSCGWWTRLAGRVQVGAARQGSPPALPRWLRQHGTLREERRLAEVS